jgi:hypothetical protein
MHTTRLTRLLVLALLMLALSAASFAGIIVSITVAPPPLPVYVQPVCPQPGYMWTPGYWAWSDEGYYWVPGTWVPAPAVGLLWTPGYWGWVNGYYRWNAGYWGPHIGFYGGVNYGFGYGGVGFFGGEWRHGGFFYNSAVVNVGGAHITNVYVDRTVIVNNTTVNHVSFNGPGGIQRAPNPAEQAAIHESHVQPTPQQTQHETAASRNPQLLAKNNGGRPAIAATAKAGDFSPRSAVPARAAGGKVAPASLGATARSMPPSARSTTVARPPASSTSGSHNVSRPPNTGSRPSSPAATNTASRPPASTMSQRQPPSGSRPPAPASRPSAPPRAAAPQAHSTPPAHTNAPPARPQKENEKR